MQEDNSVEKFFKSAHSPTWKLNQEKQTKKKIPKYAFYSWGCTFWKSNWFLFSVPPWEGLLCIFWFGILTHLGGLMWIRLMVKSLVWDRWSNLPLTLFAFLLQAAMCYIHIAALIAEYLKRRGKTTMCGEKSTCQNLINKLINTLCCLTWLIWLISVF